MNRDNVTLKDLYACTSYVYKSEISVRSGPPLKQKADTKTGRALVSGVPIDLCTKLATHTTVVVSMNVNRP